MRLWRTAIQKILRVHITSEIIIPCETKQAKQKGNLIRLWRAAIQKKYSRVYIIDNNNPVRKKKKKMQCNAHLIGEVKTVSGCQRLRVVWLVQHTDDPVLVVLNCVPERRTSTADARRAFRMCCMSRYFYSKTFSNCSIPTYILSTLSYQVFFVFFKIPRIRKETMSYQVANLDGLA